jgi:hypothetical protein
MSKVNEQLMITIVWGTDKEIKEQYYFDTQKELTAFVDGVLEAEGWHESVIIGDGYEYETIEEWEKEQENE